MTAPWPTGSVQAALAAIVGAPHVHATGTKLAVLGVVQGDDEAARKSTTETAPAWRVVPSSPAEVAELIALANQHEIAVIPVGNVGRTPRAQGLTDRMRLFIDSKRMDHVLRLDETSLIVHVQAGLTGLGLEKILAPRRLSVGDYPPSVLRATIGGVLSVRTPGKSSVRHGFVEDAVLGVSAVLADGSAIHTRVAPRRSTGPDVVRALCGSEGTLGFITSVVLRIHRRPETRFLSAYALPDFGAALSAVHLALREETEPSGMRAYDHAAAQAQLGADVCRPGESVLVAATAGPTDLAACDRDLIASAAEAMGGRTIDQSVAEVWWHRRQGHSEMPYPPQPALQVTAMPSKQKRVYQAVVDAVAALDHRGQRAQMLTHASRFDREGAAMFFTFMDASGQQVLDADFLQVVRTAAEVAARDAGAIPFGGENPSLAPYVEELRKKLDPKGIMNPGALRGSASTNP